MSKYTSKSSEDELIDMITGGDGSGANSESSNNYKTRAGSKDVYGNKKLKCDDCEPEPEPEPSPEPSKCCNDWVWIIILAIIITIIFLLFAWDGCDMFMSSYVENNGYRLLCRAFIFFIVLVLVLWALSCWLKKC